MSALASESSTQGFAGFPPAGLTLLARLPSLDPDGFGAERAGWANLLLQPARQFVSDVGVVLAKRVSPGLVADPRVNGSIAPINRDLRFDPHGPRYKGHLLFRWWAGAPKKTAATLFVRLEPTRIGFASGLVFASVDRWRAALGDITAAEELLRLIDGVRRATPDVEVAGADLKRVPAPYRVDHPRCGPVAPQDNVPTALGRTIARQRIHARARRSHRSTVGPAGRSAPLAPHGGRTMNRRLEPLT